MEVLSFANGSSLSAVDWVKANLESMGNISSFKVYYHGRDIPTMYQDVPDFYVYKGKRESKETTYHFILRDDELEIETWLADCNCGYGGTGPSCTQEVLQLVGIKMDYEIITRQKVVKMAGLTPYHDLNFILFKPLDAVSRKQELMAVSLKFKVAHEKWKAKKMFEVLGDIHPLRDESTEILEATYFRGLPYSTEHERYEYATNNGLHLNEPFSRLRNETLATVIENIVSKFDVELKIKNLIGIRKTTHSL